MLIFLTIFEPYFDLLLSCPFFFGDKSQDLNLVSAPLDTLLGLGVGLEYFFLEGGFSTCGI